MSTAKQKTQLATTIIRKHLENAKAEANLAGILLGTSRFDDLGFKITLQVEFELDPSALEAKRKLLAAELTYCGIDSRIAHESFDFAGMTFTLDKIKRTNALATSQEGKAYNLKLEHLKRAFPVAA